MSKYSNVSEDYFVREEIQSELNDKIDDISKDLIEKNIDFEDAESMSEVLFSHLNCEDITHDELDYIICNVQSFTTLQYLINDGKVERCPDGKFRSVKGAS